MHKQGVEKFPYYVGVNSLKEIATKEDRVCVLNITGNESKAVTPVSHTYSGNNIVFGTAPGKSGQMLKTKSGNIPVYNSVKEGIAAGHTFNTGVVYLPPSAVKDGVAELVRQNKKLQKIIILTEKVSAKDSSYIRAICQANGIDVFGGNCLGVADSWNQIRIGGALGGNAPEESLVKGSVALFSNSGNFTTTIAVYLLTHGWGTTTSVSSGKDVYIQFGPHEFFHALDNDDRSQAAVIYSEPGGYYERDLEINKPTVACVVGRWKGKLSKACGHAGSLAGSGDDALAKERWFMNYFGVNDIYTPEKPVFSKKGAVVTNIAHIPEALTKVMELNETGPDFAPKGDLSLKCWFGDSQGLTLPEDLDCTVVEAVEPYNEQIDAIHQQVGASFPRQNLKDKSGASVMLPSTQITQIHNLSVLDASKASLEENIVFSLLKEYPGKTEKELANIILNAYVNLCEDPVIVAADAARESGSSPNTVVSTALGIIGKNRVQKSSDTLSLLVDIFKHTGIEKGSDQYDFSKELAALTAEQKSLFKAADGDTRSKSLLDALAKMSGKGIFIEFIKEAAEGNPSSDALLGAFWASIGWASFKRRKISRVTLLNLPWNSRIFSTIIGCSAAGTNHKKDSFYGVNSSELIERWSFSEVAFLSILGRRPETSELFEFNILLGLIISNGPGTISAQGCKGAVSADGPEDPTRVQINKAFLGFLTHTGFAHGGNGYEAIAFLIEQFEKEALTDPGQRKHGLDLKAIADKYSLSYAAYKKKEKAAGNIEYKKVPCVNHPIFKGKDVNFDPRERFVSKLFEEKGTYNIFFDFYHNLVESMFDNKVTKNVYCVNVDAIIAVILLKMVWTPLKEGKISNKDVESSAFTTFLYGRMLGCAAEIDDHINRGKNMDTRTAASKCTYVG